MIAFAALSLLASLQLIAALPQSSTRSVDQEPVLEQRLTSANIKAPGGQVKKIRYGPFDIPAMGMLENKDIRNITKPCADCFITGFEAGLEDEAGNSVNTDVGAWLHHVVMYQAGEGEKDLVCPYQPAKRTFASGNERTPIRISADGKYGIRVGATSRFSLLYDIVNESDKPVSYYITITYEFSSDKSIKPAEVIYLDVTGNCGMSYVAPRDGKYTISNSPGYTSAISGKLLAATGHGHDGVAAVQIKVANKTVCESQALYGKRAGYTAKPMADMPGMTPGMTGMPSMSHGSSPAQDPSTLKSQPSIKHISDTSICKDFGEVKAGEEVVIEAMYDTDTYGLNKLMGQFVELMGISLVYVAVE
ncbi:hypothetical protein FKW77_001751 [Venturia effusa]|uniref:Uncharacterized protein n=1 Tax=Venturia effusa TaxID=50376 RepID=A0A517L8N6_9PEZI|nr:hypothetical protein FKW77_001751 [Venturia effusa]